MSARSESSFPRADPLRVATVAAVGVAAFAASWALLHTGFYDDVAIVDTPVYRGYGDRIVDGQVPYRDFGLEYPPAALPAFALPSLAGSEDYGAVFELLMLGCGAGAVCLVALALAAAGVPARALVGGVSFAALSPLLLGPVLLSRYDLWPAVLTVAALAALARGRDRLGLGVLGLAVGAKLYPLVLAPIALAYVARRRGGREALAAASVFAAVLALVFLPFALVAPGGLARSLERQAGRPLQIESLGAGVLLAAHRVGLYEARVESSHGSQNLAGGAPDALAKVQTLVQALAVMGVWLVFARTRGEIPALFAGSAAAVASFVAFGKVLSPQFLIWLLPLVPLVLGRAGIVARGAFAAALLATQAWFPYRYWDVVALEPVAWLVLVRDLLLVLLVLVLVAATRRARAGAGTR
ncbi:MAG: glycosyltransferase 87 family protein [Actinomycetota bacterium]|nr:glycosyltransferase 87 family protein [Actinomycetota bacterium]